jgi:hypothetical protein
LGGVESCALVQAFVDAIHEESAAMNQEAGAAFAAPAAGQAFSRKHQPLK